MKPVRIIIHHSLTHDSGTVSWGAIRNYHIYTNGWDGIGYHYGIEIIGGQIETLLGRFDTIQGAHCRGNNNDSIGICVVGNYDLRAPSNSIWLAAVNLTKHLMKIHSIQTIQGHNELNPGKSCPGKYFDMNKFRKECDL